MELDRACIGKSGESALEVVALALNIEALVLGRVADDPEQPQWRLHQQRTVSPWQVEVAHDRRERRHSQEVRIVVQVFPRNVDQLWGTAQAQGDADASAPAASLGQSVAVETVDLITEQGLEQSPAEAPSVGYRGTVNPAAAARPAHLEDEVLDLQLVEGRVKAFRCFRRACTGKDTIRVGLATVDPEP